MTKTQLSTNDLKALITPCIAEFAMADSAENGIDGAAVQVRKRFLKGNPLVSHDNDPFNEICHDLVYLIVFGTDIKLRCSAY